MSHILYEAVPYVIRTCAVCGKEFHFYPGTWVYRHGDTLYCSYHCMPHTGILHENKYDSAVQQAQRLEWRNRSKGEDTGIRTTTDTSGRVFRVKEEERERKREHERVVRERKRNENTGKS